MHTKCPACSKPVALAKPPKYSPEDRWGDYRRRAQQEESAE